jgi:hypothetical protein
MKKAAQNRAAFSRLFSRLTFFPLLHVIYTAGKKFSVFSHSRASHYPHFTGQL